MDFRLSEHVEKFVAEVGAFLREHYDDEAKAHEERTGDGFSPRLHRALAQRGWVAADWPREYGGQERDPYEMYVLDREFSRTGCPRNTPITTSLVGNTLRLIGTERQKREILPRVVRGEVTIALGYTEPHCGSDVADARTRAERDGDDWLINGQKMFTTGGHLTDYVFVLARTSPDKPKRDGLTLFLVPTRSPGFEAQAVMTVGGERSNLTFYQNVRVPDWLRVGEVDGGWEVMKVALGLEQGTGYSGAGEALLEHALEWARGAQIDGRPALADPLVRERLARAALRTEVGRLLERRFVWMLATRRRMRSEGPMCKLWTSESVVADARDLLDLAGPDGLPRGTHHSPGAPGVEYFQRFSQGMTIYAGTSEVMRSLIAEQGLGLPRSRAK
jgi:alkylation response protein AidB-like acyl-CoA dehydrogenase